MDAAFKRLCNKGRERVWHPHRDEKKLHDRPGPALAATALLLTAKGQGEGYREREEERGEGIDCSPLDDDEGSFLSQKINAVLLSGRERKTRLRSFPPLLFPPQRKRIVPPAAPPLGVSGIGSREGPTSALRVTWPTLCQAVWVELTQLAY